MKGDFSRWDTPNNPNFNGVLHQQGRVELDRDRNDQTRIVLDWQNQAAKQIIGADVAAISTQEPNAFKVTQAAVDGETVALEINPGQAWINGLTVTLPGQLNVTRTATYLEPPLQDPPGNVSNIEEGTRDAVILEVWREAFNGFQQPDILIEPALGGPDTTERVLTSARFRLFRLAPDEDCHNITDKLKDDSSQKGKLKVSLEPTTATDGDCPTVEGGGYTGFEHYFYRIEIARVNGDVPMFTWSQFNGSVVGRGKCDLGGVDKRITLTANDQAIKTLDVADFYLEVVEFDEEQGFWRVTYGAEVTLNGEDLEVSTEHYVEPNIPSGKVFFRLWNGIDAIANFPKAIAPAEPTLLRDGIRLEFDDPNPTNYQPGGYWTFKVRTRDIPNSDPIFDRNVPPQGIEYHRVPLAELTWNEDEKISFDDEQIEDCRDIFRPLTQQKGCCTFTVGDGVRSRGNFNTIEEAIRHLPSSGGKICLLPGLHETNLRLDGKRNITIEGCGKQTRVIPSQNNRESPIFNIIDSECIALLDLDLVTLGGTAIVLEGTEIGKLKEIDIGHNRILACEEAIHVKRGVEIHIHHNQIRMLDKEGAGVAIYIMAEDSLIERNDIGVIPAENTPPPDPTNGQQPPNPTDLCANLEIVYTHIPSFIAYINTLWAIALLFIPQNPFKALGGFQIAGGSKQVKVWENRINGGAGNGIALGSSLEAFLADLEEKEEGEEQSIQHEGGELSGRVMLGKTGLTGITIFFERDDGPFLPSPPTEKDGHFVIRDVSPGSYEVAVATPGYKIASITFQEGPFGEFSYHQIEVVQEEMDLSDLLAFMYEIEIARNEISQMGLSGIGLPRVELSDPFPKGAIARLAKSFAPFFAIVGNPVIGLEIRENHIFNCFQNPLNEALRSELTIRGLGGISLGFCAKVALDRNHIENNGINHINPVCGVFILYGEQIDIAGNWIVDNGPLSNIAGDPILGRRGGIVIGSSSFSILSLLSTALCATKSTSGVANTNALLEQAAAQVQGNIVNQPAGQALAILAIGAVSIVNNHFNSELSGPEFFDRLAGAVLIVNLGGLNRLSQLGVGGAIAPPNAIASIPTNPETFTRNPSADLLLPNGNTLFNSNLTRSSRQNTSLTGQWIFSVGDIGFAVNQSDNLGGLSLPNVGILAVNTVLWSMTLRASDSRFQEIFRETRQSNAYRISLITWSILMNNTTHNQGDHCIFAFNTHNLASPPLVTDGNQVLDATFCREFFPPQ